MTAFLEEMPHIDREHDESGDAGQTHRRKDERRPTFGAERAEDRKGTPGHPEEGRNPWHHSNLMSDAEVSVKVVPIAPPDSTPSRGDRGVISAKL